MGRTRKQIRAIKARQRPATLSGARGFGEFIWSKQSPKQRIEASEVFYSNSGARVIAKKDWRDLSKEARKDLSGLFHRTAQTK